MTIALAIGPLLSEIINNHESLINFKAYGQVPETSNVQTNRIENSDLYPNATNDFTLLVYIVGSDLEDSSYEATTDIGEMLKANPITSNINILLQTGGAKGKIDDKRLIDFSTTQRHKIVNNSLHTLENLGAVNMGENHTLMEFIKWGISQYPAKKYGLILWDHGASINGFGKDVNFDNDVLHLYELKWALLSSLGQASKIFEFIGFDSCLMGSIETASFLSVDPPYILSKFLIASEEIEPNWGWNYTHILNFITANPEIKGNLLGKKIIESYVEDSKRISKEQKFHADRDITLSVIDMARIPELKKVMDELVTLIIGELRDRETLAQFLRSIDLTEHYGQNTQGSYGLVDLYDFLINLGDSFPTLTDKIDSVKNILNYVIVEQYNGESHPNSRGLSIFLPVSTEEIQTFNVFTNQKRAIPLYSFNWLKFLGTNLFALVDGDQSSPLIQSDKNGDTINIHVSDSDIQNIYTNTILKASNGGYIQYVQNLDPSTINQNRFFNYKADKMLALCNEHNCVPISMIMDVSKGLKKIFVPVEIRSESGKTRRVSLSFELQNNNYFFLGGIQQFNMKAGEPFPKEKISLIQGDKIFPQGMKYDNSIYYLKNSKTIKQRINSLFSTFEKDQFLDISDPQKIGLRLIGTNQSSVHFTFCDLSDNCERTRVYDINAGYDNSSNVPNNAQSYILRPTGNINNFSNADSTDRYIYLNQEYGYQLEYPSDWFAKTVNMYNDEISTSSFNDPLTASFFPIKEIINNPGSGLTTSLSINVQDSVHYDDPKQVYNYFNSSRTQRDLKNVLEYELLNASKYFVNGNEAFEFIQRSQTQTDKDFGRTEKRMAYTVAVVFNKKQYTLSFESPESKFYDYIKIVKDVISTFKPNQLDVTYIVEQQSEVANETQIIQNIRKSLTENSFKSIGYKNYIDPKHNFAITYPYRNELNNVITNDLEKSHYIAAMILPKDSLPFDQRDNDPVVTITIFNNSNIRDDPALKEKILAHKLDEVPDPSISSWSVTKEFPRYVLSNSSNIKLMGYVDAAVDESSYFLTKFQSQINEKRVYAVVDDKFVMISMITPPLDYDFYEPLFDQMIRSFTIVDHNIVKPTKDINVPESQFEP